MQLPGLVISPWNIYVGLRERDGSEKATTFTTRWECKCCNVNVYTRGMTEWRTCCRDFLLLTSAFREEWISAKSCVNSALLLTLSTAYFLPSQRNLDAVASISRKCPVAVGVNILEYYNVIVGDNDIERRACYNMIFHHFYYNDGEENLNVALLRLFSSLFAEK